MPLAQAVSTDLTLLVRVPAGHLLPTTFLTRREAVGTAQGLGQALSLSWCMATHLFELSKSVFNYRPNQAGSATTTELQTEGPLVSPMLRHQACQIEKQINMLVG